MAVSPGLTDYLQSPYLIEVVVILLLGWFLRSPWRLAIRNRGPSHYGWRLFSLITGRLCLALATAAWLFLVYVTVSALHTSFNPSVSRPPSLVFVIVGGFAYLMIVGFSGLALDAAVGRLGEDRRRINNRDR